MSVAKRSISIDMSTLAGIKFDKIFDKMMDAIVAEAINAPFRSIVDRSFVDSTTPPKKKRPVRKKPRPIEIYETRRSIRLTPEI